MFDNKFRNLDNTGAWKSKPSFTKESTQEITINRIRLEQDRATCHYHETNPDLIGTLPLRKVEPAKGITAMARKQKNKESQ